MKEKTKNVIILILFILIFSIVLILNICTKDIDISITERRKLKQFPKLTTKTVFNGKFSNELETYFVDQFVGRDLFKNIKTSYSMNVMRKKDENKLFVRNGNIFKIEYPLNEKNIRSSTGKIKYVYEKYLHNKTNMNIYYSIIPDKTFYLEEDTLKMDYNEIESIINEELANTNIQYIDIKDCLNLDSYYKTDIHWRQERLQKVVGRLQEKMLLESEDVKYEIKDVGKFYGVNYGQINSRDIIPDDMKIVTNDTINNAKTYNYETKTENKVYDNKKTKDKYDTYLSGPVSIIDIEKDNKRSGKELLLFRDSYGSSLAPLLLENYDKITLIDLRYVSKEILDKVISFDTKNIKTDVLFLYSGLVLNQNILK